MEKKNSGMEKKKGGAGNILLRMKKTIKAFLKKAAALFKDFEKLKKLYGELATEKNKKSLALLIKEGKKLLKEALPKKGDGYLILGLSDPYETGKAMQPAAFFYPFYESFFKVIPDFEEEKAEGKIKASGRVRVIVVLRSLLKLYRDKNLMRLLKKIMEA